MLVCLPMLAMCDRRDLSGIVESANTGRPTAFLYDRFLGGLGFCENGYARIEDLLAMCRRLVAECACEDGCPSCVGLANLRPPLHQDPDLAHGYAIPSKEAALALLGRLAG
jgi:DEAD/DEAH box helicase domain-containing protein